MICTFIQPPPLTPDSPAPCRRRRQKINPSFFPISPPCFCKLGRFSQLWSIDGSRSGADATRWSERCPARLGWNAASGRGLDSPRVTSPIHPPTRHSEITQTPGEGAGLPEFLADVLCHPRRCWMPAAKRVKDSILKFRLGRRRIRSRG